MNPLTPEQRAKIVQLATGIMTSPKRLPDGALVRLSEQTIKSKKTAYIAPNSPGIIIGAAYDPIPTGSKWIYHTFFFSPIGEQRFSFFRDDEIEPAEWEL